MLVKLVTFVVVFLVVVPVLVNCLDPGAFNDDVLGLIVFKAGLIDPESKLQSWSEDAENACNFDGVKCDLLSNRVSEIVLDNFSLSGHIGRSLLRLQFLRVLSLSKNNLTGAINPALAQISSLNVIDLSENSLSGPVPDEFFRQCGSLKVVSFAKNNLSGVIPVSLFSCSTLERVNLSSNQLSGELPSGFFWSLSSLKSFDVSENFLEGEIPKEIESLYDLRLISLRKNSFVGQLPENIGNCVKLESIDLSGNALVGYLPDSMRKLGLCTSLNLRGNLFTGEFPDWIGDMRSLEILDLSANNFSGIIPESIGYLQFLKEVNFSNNQFMGNLPDTFENWISLLVLDVSKNLLNGKLPSWIFKLGLKSVFLSGNKFNGSIGYDSMDSKTPLSYQTLQVLDLSMNSLSGEIPSSIGNFSSLEILNVSGNSLYGGVPSTMGKLNVTRILDLSRNRLNGTIPREIGGAVSLQELRMESNFLTGLVPKDIINCSSLSSLVLSRNNLSGQIPAEVAKLPNLQILDLSFNNFSKTLPKELTNLTHLLMFNVSHNHLEGELPVGGFFNTIPLSSVTENPSLCGSVLNRSCPAVHQKPIVLNPNSDDSDHNSLSSFGHKRIMLSISSIIAIGAAVFIALGVVTVTILNSLHVKSSVWQSSAPMAFSGGDEFSHSNGTESNHNYGKLVMFSGDTGFASGTQALLNKDCELGHGGFGSVYKTELVDGRSVAIKKLNVSSLTKSREDFEREVTTLGNVRHKNVVAIEGYYWTPPLQLVINEYVSGGSLYKNLHEDHHEGCLSWQQRFNIVLGTAKGLSHLHKKNIIHYNMKSTNVLIDNSGDPKVGDFGLARLLPGLDRYILSSKIQSALGYMAPEFACQTVKITEKCDVYGFGILILEVMTGKKPVQYMEDDVVVLCDMVRRALEDGNVEDCIDKRLQGKFPVEEAIPVVKLGLICASHVPSNRPDMEEVIRILELIKSPSTIQENVE